jgi:Cd2+/Zn2+-exporting ATPase
MIPIRVVAAPPATPCCDGDGGEHQHDHAKHGHGHHHAHAHAAADACCTPASQASAMPLAPEAPPPDAQRLRCRIDNMDCPTEERLIRNRLEGMDGVVRLDFNLINRELTVYHRLPDTQAVIAALSALDMAPTVLEAGAPVSALPPALPQRERVMLALSGCAAMGAEATAWATGQESSWLVMLCAALSMALAGLPTLKKGWIALRNLTLNIYFLMTLAVVGALLIGKWSEAAMVVFLFALAEAIEALSLERARQAIQSLSTLTPDVADVMRHGQWQRIPVQEVPLGSRIRVRTGERVPLDAHIAQGRVALDQSPITGESLPVDKTEGDAIYAGSIVTDGVLEAVVSAAAGQSTLARISSAIQEAQSQRAPTQRFVDQFARYYTPTVVLLALAVAVLGPLLTGGHAATWLYQALVMLVIACPCALVVSTPVTVVSGLAAAARMGILIKGGAHLESGRQLKVMALDKTGTLTLGKPALTDVIALRSFSEAQVLHLAASLDEHSQHPVAMAVVAGWRAREPADQLAVVQDFTVLPGRGVSGQIAGQTWHLGNHRQVEDMGLCSPALEQQLAVLEGQGKTAFVLINAEGPAGLLAVADTVRPQSASAIAALHAQGVRTVMLTGDNAAAAQHVARQIGLDEVRGHQLPQDKLQAVSDLSTAVGPVGMVGDGINDAPALARAHIGFAMGAAGTATALETADVAIMDDDPRKLATFIALSRQTAAVLKQNIGLALGIKAVFLALAFGGQATLWMAVFADMGASLLVVFNGLRLLRFKP